MSAKKWFAMLGIMLAVFAAAVPAINATVDPFSVFGDRIFGWYSHGMTLNPKAAKYVYTNARVGEWDAFVIGPSAASGLAPDVLAQYTGLRWYNMFNYGVDMEYTRRIAEHIIETHRPQAMILVVPLISASVYGRRADNLHYFQPLRPRWRLPFLFASPSFSAYKLRAWQERGFVQTSSDVFIAETGVYNKSRRDAEGRGCLEDFRAAYPEFANMQFANVRLAYVDENIRAIAELLDLAAKHRIEMTIVTSPMLAEELLAYDAAEVRAFYVGLAAATGGFWDFTFSNISGDPRFFDDTTHFSNNAGAMMLARMFGDDAIFVPEDFGQWVTPENAAQTAADFAAFSPAAPHEQRVPVLMYHDIVDDDVPPEVFAEHMHALHQAGFNAVPIYALQDFVLRGVPLPPNPVVITFDDGYLSNYTAAFPVLQRYGFHATIFPMGVSFGRDIHHYSQRPIRPRFGEAEARRMVESGLISLQSHAYDMHHVEGFDPEPIRRGILQRDDESEAEYIEALRRDHAKVREFLEPITGREVFAIAFPFGLFDVLSTIVLREAGITMSFSVQHGPATLVPGLPQSLLEMNRIAAHGYHTGEDIIRLIQPQP